MSNDDDQYGKNLIPIETEEGQKLLKESTTNQYETFQKYYRKQKKDTFCGVCSLAICLNFLVNEERFCEETMFELPELKKILKQKIVEMYGMTIFELEKVIKNWLNPKLQVKTKITTNESLENFKQDILLTLSSNSKTLILNYNMSVLGQGKNYGGHISPIVSFHEKENRILIFDVWHYNQKNENKNKKNEKNEENEKKVFKGCVWAKLEDVFQSMKTWDFDAKSNRGWLIIEKEE